MYYLNLALLVHDYFYNPRLPEAIKEKFNNSITINPYDTRTSGLNITYNLPNSQRTYKKPTIAGAIYWNKLPVELRKIESKATFKNKLKTIMIDNY